MAATTADLIQKTQDPGCLDACPVAASTTIYAGTLVYRDSSGYATGDDNGGANPLLGVADDAYDNSSGSNGDISCQYYKKGRFAQFVVSGMTQADVGKLIYGEDNQTLNLTATGRTKVGRVSSFVSATEVFIEINTSLSA